MTKLLLNFLNKHAKAIYWVAVLLLCDWSLSLFLNCEVGEKQAAKCAEEYYGLTKTITYRFLGTAFDFIDEHDGLVTAAATIAIAFFTLTLKKSTDRLWEAGDKQIDLIRKNVEAALISANIAKFTFDEAHAAYFTFKPIKLGGLSVGKRPTCSLEIENIGKGKATGLSWRVSMEILGIEERAFKIKRPTPGAIVGNTGRKFTDTATLKDALSEKDILALREKKSAIYVLIGVEYFDRANGDKRQSQGICFGYTADTFESQDDPQVYGITAVP